MKVQRVYIDTSVIGGCFDQEFSLWSNGLLQDFTNGIFKPVLSQLVAAEVEEAPDVIQAKLTEIMVLSPEILQVTTEAAALAELYQHRQILTPKFYNDGLHIALATIAEVDVLVSWNFKHIVHLNKIRLFNAVNMEAGYKTVQIYSPREVATI